MGGWDCPHEIEGQCKRVKMRPCVPGMRGCVLKNRVTFTQPEPDNPQNQEPTKRIDKSE